MGEVVLFGWREKEEICQDFYFSHRKQLWLSYAEGIHRRDCRWT